MTSVLLCYLKVPYVDLSRLKSPKVAFNRLKSPKNTATLGAKVGPSVMIHLAILIPGPSCPKLDSANPRFA